MKTVVRRSLINVLLVSGLFCNLAAMEEGSMQPLKSSPQQSHQPSSLPPYSYGSSSSAPLSTPASAISSSLSSSSVPLHASAYDSDSDDEKTPQSRKQRYAARTAQIDQRNVEEEKVPSPKAVAQQPEAPLAPRGNLIVFSRADYERVLHGDKNFTNADLRAIDLRGADLSNANLTGADLSGRNQEQLKDLTEIKLKDANLANANLAFTNLDKADLDGATLSRTNLFGAVIKEALLRGTKFLDGTSLAQAKLVKSTFHRARIVNKIIFFQAILRGIKFLQTAIDGIDMRKINAIELFFIDCPTVKNIDFTEANITNMVVMDIGIIGPQINFDRAEIHESCFIGKVIRRTADHKERTEGITEGLDNVFNVMSIVKGVSCEVSAMLGTGAGAAAATAFICPPVGIAMAIGGGLWSIYISATVYENSLDDKKLFAPININTIIKAANFTGAKLDKVRFSNIKFGDCTDIEGIETASGCVLSNVISSDPADLQRFKRRMAKVNGEYENALYGVVIERDPDLSSMGERLLRLVAGTALGAAGTVIGGQALGSAAASIVL
jgi:uncharacterized protein YjbI with pentapeptide repeats